MEGRRLAVREKSRKSLIAFERRIKCLRESPIRVRLGKGKRKKNKKEEQQGQQQGHKDAKIVEGQDKKKEEHHCGLAFKCQENWTG